MFKEREKFYEIEEFFNFGAGAVYSKINAGNLSYYVLNEEEKVKNNRMEIMKELGIEDYKVFYAKQTHSDNIKIIEDNDIEGEYDNIDGFVTDRKDVVILTQYADCLPVYFYDENKNIIALVHAGWQGLYSAIHIKMLDIMKKRYGSNIEEIKAAVGIGIKECCYEISDEFYNKFYSKFGKDKTEKSFKKIGERYHFDLEKFAEITLIEKGVKEKNIIKSNICTKCSNKFHSYRRDKEKSGRNGALIFIKKGE